MQSKSIDAVQAKSQEIIDAAEEMYDAETRDGAVAIGKTVETLAEELAALAARLAADAQSFEPEDRPRTEDDEADMSGAE